MLDFPDLQNFSRFSQFILILYFPEIEELKNWGNRKNLKNSYFSCPLAGEKNDKIYFLIQVIEILR